ncbi:tetratricopeptide repeat protein [Sporolactobacillus pectinivorans]|uniref:tetratricopeptide repeat protein n=1 Tax=Sporolactobacillus pectinivorans TaxID=1591408 RepID=UPI000C2682C7|nr:tetratricopeptide repeat protein [Sporolactobacillus pectinivorans]
MSKGDHSQKKQVISLRYDGDFFYQKGMTCYQKGDLERASRYIDRALKIKPNEVEYLCQQAAILSELEDYTSSIDLLKKIVHELDAQMTECYFFMANNYAYLGEFDEALAEVRTYMALEPHGAFAHEARELFDMLSSETQDMDEYEEPPYISLHERGRAALEHGRFEESIYFFKKVIREEPDYLAAQNNLMIAYFSTGATEEALAAAEAVLEKDPGNIHTLCNLATFFYQLGDDDNLQKIMGRLGNIYPILPEHCGKIGSTYLFIGDYEKAYYWLKIAERRGVRSDQVFCFWMALSAYHMNHQEQAERYWEQVDYFSSKPFHPFKYTKIQDMMFETGAEKNFMIGDLLREEIWDGSRGYQLFSLFYLARSESVALLEEIYQKGPDAQIKGLAGRFILERQSGQPDARIRIMRIVEELIGGEKEAMKHPELYSFWFVVDPLIGLVQIDCSGWAAALFYLWKKEFGMRMSQKAAADLAGTTVYRIRKHVTELTRSLDSKWEEKLMN